MFIGNGLYSLSQIGFIVLLARTTNSTQLGMFAFALAFTAPVILFATMQLPVLLATDAQRRFRFVTYLSLGVLLYLAAILFIGGLSARLQGFSIPMVVVLLIGLSKAIDATSQILYATRQRQERMVGVGVGRALNGLSSLAGAVIAALVTHSVVWVSVATACGSALALALVAVPLSRRALRAEKSVWPGQLGPAGPETARLARLAFPLGCVSGILAMNGALPTLVIQDRLGYASVGAFAAVAYLILAPTTLTSALSTAAAPRLAKLHIADRPGVFRLAMFMLLAVFTGIGLAITAVAWLAGPALLHLIYHAGYGHMSSVFVVLALGLTINLMGSALGCGMTAARVLRVQVLIAGATLAVTSVLSLLLVGPLGIIGVAWATVGGYVVLFFGAWIAIVPERGRGQHSPLPATEASSGRRPDAQA
jgi:O-antigen/teichoic acid export membrane protein